MLLAPAAELWKGKRRRERKPTENPMGLFLFLEAVFSLNTAGSPHASSQIATRAGLARLNHQGGIEKKRKRKGRKGRGKRERRERGRGGGRGRE